jgi:heat-inducible transcriptional repressor
VFLSAPHFEHDYITSIKLAAVDNERAVAILTTDFGEIITQVLHVTTKLTTFLVKKAEEYFHWRLTGKQKPLNLTPAEEELAQGIYNELLVRYIVSYTNFQDHDLYRTGFSSLLVYPEYRDPTILANTFSLFENAHGLRQILKESEKLERLKFWIGDDLLTHAPGDNPSCAAIAIPYYVNNNAAGAVGILGPTRLPYRALFGIMRHFSSLISETMTKNLYKFKITLRQAKPWSLQIDNEIKLIGDTRRLQIEHKEPEVPSRPTKTGKNRSTKK